MIKTILTTVLAFAVIVMAVLFCAMRKRMARVEQAFHSAIVLHNRRLWETYHFLHWYAKTTTRTVRLQRQDMEKGMRKLDEVFNFNVNCDGGE